METVNVFYSISADGTLDVEIPEGLKGSAREMAVSKAVAEELGSGDISTWEWNYDTLEVESE